MWKPFTSKSQNSSLKKKVINYYELFDIIDFYSNIEKSNKPDHRIDYDKYIEKTKTAENQYVSEGYNMNPHFRRIKDKVNELGLEDNIRILGGGRKTVREAGFVFPFDTEIEIRDLEIKTEQNLEIFLKFWHNQFDEIGTGRSVQSQGNYKGGLLIVFKNNHFIQATEKHTGVIQTGNGDGLYLCFEKNTFTGVDIYMGGNSDGKSFIELKNNIFDNRHVTIAMRRYNHFDITGKNSDGNHVSGECLTRKKAAAHLENWVNEEALKRINEENYEFTLKNIFHLLFGESKLLRVSSDDVTEDKPNSYIFLDGNKFTTLSIGGKEYCFLHGKNMIERLEPGIPEYISFSSYEEIDKAGNYPDYHRRAFIKLHEKAIERNDLSQAKILHLEIRKCEHKELRQMPWISTAFQDKVIMEFSYHMSRYNTSWARPLAWLAIANLFFTAFVCFLLFDSGKFTAPIYADSLTWSVFWNFFNPITYLPTILGAEQTGTFTAIDVIQKALLALLGFEIMKAFRHLTTKS